MKSASRVTRYPVGTRNACAVIGRDPFDIEWSVGVEPDDLRRFFDEDAAPCVSMGFTDFTLGFNGPDWDVDAGAAMLAWRDRMNADATVAV